MIQLTHTPPTPISYPVRTFSITSTSSTTSMISPFQSLVTRHSTPTKSPPPPSHNVFGGIIRTNHTDPHQVKYLLVQGRYSGKWSFPKGHANPNEDPLTCARREITEETGQTNIPTPVEYIRTPYGNYYVFLYPTTFEATPIDVGEIMDTRWVTLEEIDKLDVNVDISRYKKRKLKEIEEPSHPN